MTNTNEIRTTSSYDMSETIWCIDDLNKFIIDKEYQYIHNAFNKIEIKYYNTENGVFRGISFQMAWEYMHMFGHEKWEKFLGKYKIQLINSELITNNVKIQPELFHNYCYNINYKYDKKINDIFEIIKELKQDLNIKNKKIRELELRVHYLESQTDKKVKYDYNEITQRNKNLNNEFKRVAKLMKLNK